MSRTDNEVRITPSVLDRLIDYEPEAAREAVASRAKSLRQMKQSLKRDLEWLLNTRRVAENLPPDLKEVNNSLAAYGLPDFTTANIKSPADQSRLRRALESAISAFEPRLEDVVVTIDSMRDIDRVMRFRIDARLRVEPAPEPVTFDTMLQLGSGEYLVRGE
ncbi:MAG TPA: type VI secretion system baseplate subunit TssE [Blastocatellia bacterium]|jgi:type VI secretion system protein ImpF|nr:type VI secretion system baseplate subunit TssE [Blastocatellia bacterium]